MGREFRCLYSFLALVLFLSFFLSFNWVFTLSVIWLSGYLCSVFFSYVWFWFS